MVSVDYYNKWAKVKVKCLQCNTEYTKGHRSNHKKSNKHKKRVAALKKRSEELISEYRKIKLILNCPP